MSSSYEIVPVEDIQKWDEFVEASPQGTVFFKSSFLASTLANYELYYINSGTEPRAGVCLVRKDNEYVLDDMIIYNGIIFAQPKPNQNPNGVYSEQFKLTEKLIEFFEEKNMNLTISLSPKIKDIRPYLWYNYNGNQKEKFNVSVRFTSYLDINELGNQSEIDKTSIFLNMDSKRRQSIRKAEKLGANVRICSDVSILKNFYEMTFEKQGKTVDKSKLNQIESVAYHSIRNHYGKLYVASNGKGDDASVALFINDSKRSYYMFGANNYKVQDDYSGTIVLWEGFRDLAMNNVKEVDLEGINSPERGWFKMSFGGNIKQYYELSLRQH